MHMFLCTFKFLTKQEQSICIQIIRQINTRHTYTHAHTKARTQVMLTNNTRLYIPLHKHAVKYTNKRTKHNYRILKIHLPLLLF